VSPIEREPVEMGKVKNREEAHRRLTVRLTVRACLPGFLFTYLLVSGSLISAERKRAGGCDWTPRESVGTRSGARTWQSNASEKGGVKGEGIIRDGLSVKFSMRPLGGQTMRAGNLLENEDVECRFDISDAATGTPLKGAHPAAWMDLKGKDEGSDSNACAKKISSYLSAGLIGPRPIDLNSYYVMSLNQDSTITVVDPRFGYGGTKLLAMMTLRSPGEDWALTADQNGLFVSEPGSDRVAAADTASWKVIADIATGPHPTRVALQPDEQYLWVAYGDQARHPEDSGVSVISTTSLKEVARIRTGRGAHDIAFSDDNRYAFATNSDEGTVSVMEVKSLRKTRDLSTGVGPASIAFSVAAGAAYVTNEGDGTIAALRADRADVERMRSEPGLGQIRFAPGGRFGFVVNAAKGKVYIVDASSNRIIQTAAVDGGPDQVTFSSTLAYIRRRNSETVFVIPFSQIGAEGKPIPVADFPGGQHALGGGSKPSPADTIVQVPNENAVLVANPGDKSIYYYMEGMAAPMGNFSNYGREPRAVLVVDRGLRGREPGVYRAVAKLRGPGIYEVAFLLESPRVVHCFEVKVDSDPGLEAKTNNAEVKIQPVKDFVMTAGKTTTVQFKVVDSKKGEAIQGLKDLRTLALLAPGIWNHRQFAAEGPGGVYSIELAPPRPGIYYIYLECRSIGLRFGNGQYLIVEAKPAGADGRQ
jgi:DNA-binding beta-propeller fold protein YncE